MGARRGQAAAARSVARDQRAFKSNPRCRARGVRDIIAPVLANRQLRQWGVAAVALGCLLVAVLPIGGIPPLAARIAAPLLAVAGVAASTGSSSARVALPYALLSAWSLLQVVPLPLGVLEKLSPRAAEVWRDALSPVGGAVASAPLSLCPEATWLEVAKWGGLGGAALLGAAAQRRSGLSRSIAMGLVAALVVAAAHVGHGLAGARRVWGVYTPVNTFSGFHVGPLLNVNTLSGYLLLGVFAGLALVYSSRLRQTAAMAVVLATTCSLVIGVVVLASRSAVAALLVGSILATGLYLARWRGDARKISGVGAIAATAAIVGIGGGLAVLGFGGEIARGLGEKNFTKLRVVSDAASMVRDYPLFGVGRGAFSGIYHLYRTVPDDEFWTHPENVAVAFSVEWGVPATIVAVVAFAWLTFASRPGRSAARLVLMTGVATVVLQNLFDFGLEALGVGALSAYLWGVAASAEGTGADVADSLGRPVRAAVAALALVGAALSGGATLPLDARRQAFAASRDGDVAAVSPYLARFPADPYFPLLGGMVAGAKQPTESLRWYNRGLQLAPRWGLVHLELARALARLGARRQALMEARLVVDSRSTSAKEALALAVSLARSADELSSMASVGAPNEAEVLRTLWGLVPPTSAFRGPIEERLLAGSPCEVAVLVARADASLRDLRAESATCSGPAREACLTRVVEIRDKLRGCPDGGAAVARLSAELTWEAGDHKAALDAMEAACAGSGSSIECFEALAARAASVKDFPRMQRATRVVTSARCASPPECAAAWAWAAQLHRAAGDLVGTYLVLQKSADVSPTADGYRATADAALAAGMRDRAIVALRRAVALDPSDEASRAKISALEAARPASSTLLPPRPAPRPRAP